MQERSLQFLNICIQIRLFLLFQIPIMIACNKQDLDLAKTDLVIIDSFINTSRYLKKRFIKI